MMLNEFKVEQWRLHIMLRLFCLGINFLTDNKPLTRDAFFHDFGLEDKVGRGRRISLTIKR